MCTFISLVVAVPLTSAIKGVSLVCCTGMGGVVVLRVSVGGWVGGGFASLCVRVLLLFVCLLFRFYFCLLFFVLFLFCGFFGVGFRGGGGGTCANTRSCAV